MYDLILTIYTVITLTAVAVATAAIARAVRKYIDRGHTAEQRASRVDSIELGELPPPQTWVYVGRSDDLFHDSSRSDALLALGPWLQQQSKASDPIPGSSPQQTPMDLERQAGTIGTPLPSRLGHFALFSGQAPATRELQ